MKWMNDIEGSQCIPFPRSVLSILGEPTHWPFTFEFMRHAGWLTDDSTRLGPPLAKGLGPEHGRATR